MSRYLLAIFSILIVSRCAALEPIPNKLVVLTFDDSVKSHFQVVRPILKRYGFGATFYITEGFDFKTNKEDYMTWDEIAQLHRDGFEIGNHTRDHSGVRAGNVDRVAEQIEALAQQCVRHGIARPVTFAWPGNVTALEALPVLEAAGIKLARRGGNPEYSRESGKGFAYQPGLDHPLLIPSAGVARPDWTMDDFQAAADQARFGQIAVLQFHGVPDRAHPWVDTPPAQFEAYMQYLANHDFRVISMRDLLQYVDPTVVPHDPNGVIADRQEAVQAGRSRDNFRRPESDVALRRWLDNMLVHHRFTYAEVAAATGMSDAEIATAAGRLGIEPQRHVNRRPGDPLTVLPYPGGRHPRIGFRDGAIRPQRDTKISIFAPWHDGGYVVVDVPEAIWFEPEGGRQLLYLAHTHVPTYWTRRGVTLEPVEWRVDNGLLRAERKLPNNVVFGADITPKSDGVEMRLWLRNGSDQTLTGMRVQNCVMLKDATGFAEQTRDNKVQQTPLIACHNESRDRWIITAWEPCNRTWPNPDCPCMHSDPQIPDCQPGETQQVVGWLSFYEGTEIETELNRVRNRLNQL